jgi:hypothetical protein
VLRHEVFAEGVDPFCHRAGKAVHGGRTGTRRRQHVRIGRRDAPGVETAETLRERAGTTERLFHRDLLVEQHADQQREPAVREQRVGRVVLGKMQHTPHALMVTRAANGALRIGGAE